MTTTQRDADRPPTVAVMGGTGFMGRAISRALIEAGHPVLSVARNHPAGSSHAGFVSLDLGEVDSAELARVLAEHRVGTVVNAAGGMWGLTDEQMVTANVTLVENLVAAMASLPWQARLIQLGSVHEYGLVPIGTSITEDAAAMPSMAYGKLKVEATDVILAAVRDGLIDGLVLRLGNVVGAGQPHHSLLGVIADKLDAAAGEGRPAALTLAPLAAKRDFFDLDDAADAVLAAVGAQASGRVVNIGSGGASSAREVVELLIKVSGVPTEIENTTGTNGETDDLEWQQLEVGLAFDVLGWAPKRDLSNAVESLWAARSVGRTDIR